MKSKYADIGAKMINNRVVPVKRNLNQSYSRSIVENTRFSAYLRP